MKRYWNWPFLMTLAIVLTACTAPAAASPTPALYPSVTPTASLAATSILTPTIAITPTRTPRPTKKATPTQTLIPTETPPSPLKWADAFPSPVILDGFTGVWSPVANEMVGIQGTAEYTGTLTLVSAPDFNPRFFQFDNARNAWWHSTWSPNGQILVFGIHSSGYGDISIDHSSDIWAVKRDGSGLKMLSEGYRGLDFPWWMDEQTVVATSYNGGGHEIIDEIDVISGQELVSDLVHVFYMPRPQGIYLPVVSGEAMVTTYIVTRDWQGQSPLCSPENCYTREFPLGEIDFSNPLMDTYFEDWQPNTLEALISVAGYTNDNNYVRLFLWDITTDKITAMMPGGMNARFSPDGKNLLFTTIGASSAYSDDITSTSFILDKVPDENTIYLQLMNLQDRQVLLSLPMMLQKNYWNIPREYFSAAQFSADGHFLAFLTTGPLQLDDQGWPVRVNASNPAAVYLNVLDLQNRRLVYSFPNVEYYLQLYWSPTSDCLVYQDAAQNWNLVDLAHETILPITQAGGWQLDDPSWSYDGHYLSFPTRVFYVLKGELSRQTFILEIPTGH